MEDGVNGKVSIAALPSLDALLELDEMCINEFHQASKAGDRSEVVVLRPELELCSYSFIDESVHDETKTALNARSGSSIFKNPSDPTCPSVKESQEVVYHNMPSVLPLIQVYVMKLTWFLESITALHGSFPCQRRNATSLKNSIV